MPLQILDQYSGGLYRSPVVDPKYHGKFTGNPITNTGASLETPSFYTTEDSSDLNVSPNVGLSTDVFAVDATVPTQIVPSVASESILPFVGPKDHYEPVVFSSIEKLTLESSMSELTIIRWIILSLMISALGFVLSKGFYKYIEHTNGMQKMEWEGFMKISVCLFVSIIVFVWLMG